MKVKKLDIEKLWVPKEIDALWNLGDGIMKEHCGGFQYLLLDNLHSKIDAVMDDVSFAEKFGSYEKYEENFKAGQEKSGMSDSGIKALVDGAKEEKQLEHGKLYLEKGIDTQKLRKAKVILEKCLE